MEAHGPTIEDDDITYGVFRPPTIEAQEDLGAGHPNERVGPLTPDPSADYYPDVVMLNKFLK